MSPEQFEEEMKKCDVNDEEKTHINMDYLMCQVLRELGYGKGIDIFEEAPKYYA